MGSKDPFNFDDIYKEAGLETFVKKSMAEQKAMAKAAPATPPRPVPPQHSNSPVMATSPGAISQLSRPAASSTVVRPPTSGSSSKASSTTNLAGLDDPFAGLGGFSKPPPMSAQKTPVRSATPPRAAGVPAVPEPAAPSFSPVAAPAAPPAAAPAAANTHSHFDLEDMFGDSINSSSSSSQKQQAALQPTAAGDHDDPFAAFGGVEGVAPAVPAAQQPVQGTAPAASSSPLQQQQPAATAATAAMRDPSPSTHNAARISNSSNSTSSSSRPAAEASSSAEQAVPSSAYFARYEQQQQQQPQQQQVGQDRMRPAEQYRSQRHDMPGSFSNIAAERRYGYGSEDGAAGSFDHSQGFYGGPTDDSLSGSSAGGKGWGGLFKSVTKTAANLGKKGLKAAQAGLAQLETAIDSLDKQPSGRISSTDGRSGHSSHYHHQQHQQQQHEDAHYDDMPAERVLSMAIHISELPSSRQDDALARLPRPVRAKVMALLREQAVIEGEEQLQASTAAAGSTAAAAGTAAGFITTQEYKLDDEDGSRQTSSAVSAAAAPVAAAAAGRAAAVATEGPPAAPPAPAVEEEDLLGIHGPTPAAAATAAAAPSPRPVDRLSSVSGMDDFFSGGAAAAPTSSTAARPHTAGSGSSRSAAAPTAGMSRVSGSAGQLGDLLGGGGGAAAAASKAAGAGGGKSSSVGDLMGGLEVLHVDVDVTGHSGLYEEGDGTLDNGGEPAIRRQLRAARAAEKHAKMKAALAEKQQKEAEETARREHQQQHKQAHRDRIDVWRNKNKGNVRGLLSSLQTVLWEDSGWQPLSMADLLEPAQVRKAWMKANLLVHPDKVRQRNGGDEQVAIADMIFDALKEAWGQFKG